MPRHTRVLVEVVVGAAGERVDAHEVFKVGQLAALPLPSDVRLQRQKVGLDLHAYYECDGCKTDGIVAMVAKQTGLFAAHVPWQRAPVVNGDPSGAAETPSC
jgi:hypothetical protein